MSTRIAIHSVPRSGSTWLGEIFNSSPSVKYGFQPLFSYTLKDFLDASSSERRIAEFFDELLRIDDEFIDQRAQREAGTLPRFDKRPPFTHVCYKEVRYHNILENLARKDPDVRLVLLVRNPVEVMNSWIGAPREFDKRWDIDEELLSGASKNQGRAEEFYGLEQWIAATRIFRGLSTDFPDRATLVTYRDLNSDPLAVSERLFDFCGLSMTAATRHFLDRSTTETVSGTYSVFRGSAEKAVSHLAARHVAMIEDVVREAGLEEYLR